MKIVCLWIYWDQLMQVPIFNVCSFICVCIYTHACISRSLQHASKLFLLRCRNCSWLQYSREIPLCMLYNWSRDSPVEILTTAASKYSCFTANTVRGCVVNCYLGPVLWTAGVQRGVVHTGVRPEYLVWPPPTYLETSSISRKEVGWGSLPIFWVKLDFFCCCCWSEALSTLWKPKGSFFRGHINKNAIIRLWLWHNMIIMILSLGKSSLQSQVVFRNVYFYFSD